MRIAITGATGNLGTALLRRLQAHGGHELVGIARRRPPEQPPYAGVTWHRVDVAAPDAADQLRAPFTGADAVVHLVWGFQPSHRREYLRATGVGGTAAVLRAAAETGVEHLVHMSSSAVYSAGSYGRRVDETWPTGGIAASVYSQDKVAAERLIDAYRRAGTAPTVTVLRPGLIGQYQAGNQLLGYIVPDWVPQNLLRLLWLLPMDTDFCVPAVHADDVADAILRALDARPGGIYNVAADNPADASDVLAGFGARGLDVPVGVLRGIAEATWRLHLQPVDGGWVDLAYGTPLLDCTRIRDELDWTVSHSGGEVLRETIAGMRDRAGTDAPILARRSFAERLLTAARRGGVGERFPS